MNIAAPTTPDTFSRRIPAGLTWGLLAVGLIVSLVALYLKLEPHQAPRLAIELAPVIAAGAGAAACLICQSRLHKAEVRYTWAWRLLAAALCCLTVGQVFRILQLQLHGTPPFPSVGDMWWSLQQPLLWSAILLLAWPKKSRTGIRIICDALILVLAALVGLWSVLLEPLFLSSTLTQPQKILSLYYPLSSVVLLFCASLLLSSNRTRAHLTRTTAFLLSGTTVFIVSELVFSFHLLHHSDFYTRFVELGWAWASILIGAAALAQPSTAASADATAAIPGASLVADDESESVATLSTLPERWRPVILWLPYVAAILAAGVLLIGQLQRDRAETVQRLAPVLALLFALVARQMLTLWDNLALSHRLTRANSELAQVNATLEQHVRERSRHLTTLHGITSTLNTSVDRRTVLRVALERTMSAIGAEGGGIWLLPVDGAPQDEIVPGLSNDPAEKWTLVHWHSTESAAALPDEITQTKMRDLAILIAEGKFNQPGEISMVPGNLPVEGLPPSESLILVPIRWQGSMIGVLGMLRWSGEFSFEDRALVESVGLEAGTALQNVRLYQAARLRADHDPLTGLLNHRAIQEQLNSSLAQSRRLACELSIVLLDLGNFKFFNDTYGHQVGDDVLRTVARSLQNLCRATDFVGRYGGDEFILLLPETHADGSQVVCQRVLAELDRLHFEADKVKIPITASFGVAVFPHDGNSALELISHADSSLYLAKSSGSTIRVPEPVTGSAEGRKETRRLKNRATGGSFGVLDALVTAIDNKDHYTRRHSEDVTQMALLIAEELSYTEEQQRAVRISGLLHDVGKIAVPDEILRHPGKLSQDQWEIMKQHPVFGALIVKDLPHLDDVLAGVRHHHERYDGKGYPDGLAGDDIPTMGRLLAVPDCYSAMTTDRPYRKGFAPEEALMEIERSIGTQFDPLIATTFISAMRRALAEDREHPLGTENGAASTEVRQASPAVATASEE